MFQVIVDKNKHELSLVKNRFICSPENLIYFSGMSAVKYDVDLSINVQRKKKEKSKQSRRFFLRAMGLFINYLILIGPEGPINFLEVIGSRSLCTLCLYDFKYNFLRKGLNLK